LVCSEAHKNNVSLLIDGEESWMQDAADELVTDMMRKYNKEKPIVFNTLQLYRWDRLDYLKKLHEVAKREGFRMKLVRGAYMEKNMLGLNKKGIHTNLCIKEATDANYDATDYMIDHLDGMAIS
jgi:proline dehydrogenase